MERRVDLEVFHESSDVEKAERVVRRMLADAGVHLPSAMAGRYLGEGCRVTFRTTFDSASWDETVLESIRLAQRFGYGWALSGLIDDGVDLSTTEVRGGPGVLLARIVVWRSRDRPDPCE